MMGADHCAVDHLKCIRHDPAFVQGLQDLLPQTRQGPASELAVDAGPLPELCRQVTPGRACPGYPENPIKNEPMVGRFAPVRRSDGQNEALVKSPFFVRHQISCQAGLHHRYQLESRSARPVNPFCQHALGRALNLLDLSSFGHSVLMFATNPASAASFLILRRSPNPAPGEVWQRLYLLAGPASFSPVMQRSSCLSRDRSRAACCSKLCCHPELYSEYAMHEAGYAGICIQ